MDWIRKYGICFYFALLSNCYSIITKQMLDNGFLNKAKDDLDFINGIKHFMKREVHTKEGRGDIFSAGSSELLFSSIATDDLPQSSLSKNNGSEYKESLKVSTRNESSKLGFKRVKKHEAGKVAIISKIECKNSIKHGGKDCWDDKSVLKNGHSDRRGSMRNSSEFEIEATVLEGPEIQAKEGFTEREMEIFPTVETPRNHASSSKSTRFNYFLDPLYNKDTVKLPRTIDATLVDHDRAKTFLALSRVSTPFSLNEAHHARESSVDRSMVEQRKEEQPKQSRLDRHQESESRSLSHQYQLSGEDNRNAGENEVPAANSEKELNDTLWQNMRENILASLVSPSPILSSEANDRHRGPPNDPLSPLHERLLDSPPAPTSQPQNVSLAIVQGDPRASCKFHDYVFATNANCTFGQLIADLADELARISNGHSFEERNFLDLENSPDNVSNTGRRKASLKYITFLLGILVVKLLVILPLVILTAGKSIALSLLSLGVATANVFQKHQMPYVKRRDEVPTFAYDKFALSPHHFR